VKLAFVNIDRTYWKFVFYRS